MRPGVHRHLLALLLLCSPWLPGALARAALGGDAADALADAVQLQGHVQTLARPNYDIAEISTDTGMLVREFLTRDGRVFAVSWSGPVVPDLRQLLGSRFGAYQQALAASSHSGLRRSARVASQDFIVESGGHMRAYAGRAYLPALVPPGVAAAELR